MAPITQLSVLAFASAVLAVPHAQWEPLKRHAHPGAPAYGGAPPAYGASSSAAPVESSAPPSYGSSAPPSYGSSSEAAAVSSSGLAGYGSSSVVAPVSSSGLAGYGSSSVVAPVLSSGLAGYGSSGVSSFSGIPSSGYAAPTGGYGHPTGSYAWGSSGIAQPTGGYSSGPVSYSVCTETSTLIYRSTTEYSTYQITHTIYPAGSSAAAGSAPAGSSAGAGSAPAGYPTPSSAPVSPATSGLAEGSCVPDVTVTKTERSTIYVTAGPSGAAPTPSNTYAGSGSQLQARPPRPPPVPTLRLGEPAPTPSATYAPTPSSPAASSPPSGSTGSSGYAGKRGLAYNDAALTNMFAQSSYIGWSYNWNSDSQGLDSGVPYIPTLWGTDSMWTSVWAANAELALSNGAKYFFSFNEPDMPTQANLSPEAAAAAWKQYMEPYAGKVKLVAPGVTNGQSAGLGLSWLQSFLSACSDCTIDAIAQHWYWDSNDSSMFKEQIQNTIDTIGKPIWVNEFAGVGSDAEKSAFLEDVMSWMDSNDQVLGYAYFMVSDGALVTGDALSTYGATYANSA